MRLFKLINADAEEFDLMREDCHFQYPDGLAQKKNKAFTQVENNFVNTEEKPEQLAPTGEMYITSEDSYQEFRVFIQKEPLQFCANYGAGWLYLSVEVETFKKVELFAHEEFYKCPIDFKALGQWRKSLTAYQAEAETGAGKKYPYTYPYTYSRGASGSVTLNNTGDIPAPLVLTIRGPAVDPSWIVRQNGVFVSSGAVTLEITADEMLVVDARTESLSMCLCDLSGNVLLDVWQQSDMSKDNFVKAPVGESEILFAQQSGTPDATVQMVELALTV